MIMNKLFDLYVEHHLPTLTPDVQRDYRNMIENFLRPFFGHRKVHKVRPKHVRDFLNVQTGKVHRNRMVMILQSAFRRAIGDWCIEDDIVNPCPPVRRHPTRPRDRYVTEVEFEEFRAVVPASVQIAMDLALLISQRQGDLLALRWDHIEYTEPFVLLVKEVDEHGSEKLVPKTFYGYINVDQGKSGGKKKLGIAMSEAVVAVLSRAKLLEPQLPREYVIHTNLGRRYTKGGFRSLWQKYMRPWRKAHPGVTGWTFHDIRAKAVSDNESIQAASELAGHDDDKITRKVYKRTRLKVMPLR